ncbi:MAG TPA: AMP-binding protein [Myxococcota bacterium]|nr:AMP-binding protein [Myxococcota bacterium]
MHPLGSTLDEYRRAVDSFSWQMPARFNFGRDVVDRWAEDPARPALFWRDAGGAARRFSYADVSELARRAAHLFRSLGVAPGEPVIVMLPRVPEWQAVIVGLLEIGALVVPSSTQLRPKDVHYRATHSGAVAIVASHECVGAVEAVRGELPSVQHLLEWRAHGPTSSGWTDLSDALAQQPDDASAGRPTLASDPALVYYTSGTTGPPKAVLHDHSYTWTQRYTSRFWHGVRPGERLWTTSDTGWAKAAYGVIFGPWSEGAEVVLYHGRFEPKAELAFLSEIDPHVFCAPPTEFRLLVKEDLTRLAVPRMRECVSAGEPLNPEVIRAWREATGITIRDGYGQTETILLVANYPGMPVRAGAMGLPMPGIRVEVIDDRGRAMPAGEVGDIAVHGQPPGLSREYWKDARTTARVRRGEWYLTGDRAWRDADGYFWFVGRDDDVIISAGYRIGPFEVESALIEHPAVVEAAAVAAPDPDRGSIVKAFVVVRDGFTPSDALARELQEHVKRVTAPYKYPRAIEFAKELPKTVSGKIRRVELRNR